MAVAVTAMAAGFDWSYDVDPAEGVVEQLDVITVTFPGLEEIEFNSKDDIVLSYNGKDVEDVTVKLPYGKNYFTVILPEAVTAAGDYTLSVPAGCLAGYDAEYNAEDLPEDLKFNWTIEGVASEVDFTYTSSLPTDEFLAYFGELTLTFDNLDSVSCEQGGVSVTLNDAAIEDVTVSTDANKLTLTLKEALNFVDGKLVVTIAAEALTGNQAGTTGTNAAPISIEYTMASPVEYNLELAISSPKPSADGQISADKSLESIFFVCEEKNLVAFPGTEVNVTIKEVNGDFQATAHLRKTNGLNANYSYFSAAFGKEPTYNGLYTITIEKGAFGTESWAADPNYGRSNAEIELTFELVDGADRAKYTLEPVSVNPEEGSYATGNEIASVTLTFAAGVTAVKGASATLAGVDTSYTETAEFIENEDGSYVVTFENVPTEDGKYVFTVLQGLFGDEEFVEEGTGEANAPIRIEYTVDHTVGVAMTVTDSVSAVYNLQGVRMAVPADRLPAGVYIIDGKKVIIKK